MKITLDRSQLDEMQKHSKLYNYLATTLTKSYFSVGDNKFVLFFQGSKGACKTTVPIQCSEPAMFFQGDYAKLSNALGKAGFSPTVTLTITAKYLRISIDGSNDIISLAIITYPADSAEATTIASFAETKLTDIQSHRASLTMESDLVEAFTTAMSMFNTVGKNNAIAVRRDYVLYADRSVVLKARLTNPVALAQDTVILHKYTLGMLGLVQKVNPCVFFTNDYVSVGWTDGSTIVVLASEPCDIAIPSDDDLLGIVPPTDADTLTVDQGALQQGLAFFNGFYEASVWKPVTFRIAASGEASLYYKHPSTEISKNLGCTGTAEGEFVVASETVAKLTTKSIELAPSGESQKATIRYDDTAPGVMCYIGTLQDSHGNSLPRYEVILAKLVE